MKRLWLTLLTVLSTAAAQSTGSQLAQELKLPAGSYDVVTTLPHLGVPVPRGAVKLRDLRPVRNLNAADLRALQEGTPIDAGYRCVTALELVLVPTTAAEASPELARWVRETRAKVLSTSNRHAVLLAGAADPVLVQVYARPGYLLAAACRAEALPEVASAFRPTIEWADPVGSVQFSNAGLLTWCVPGRIEGVRTVRAFQGAVQALVRSVDGRWVAAVGADDAPRLKVWAAQDGRLVSSVALSIMPRNLHFTADGRTVFTTGPSGTALTNPQLIVGYDAATGREVGRVTLPPGEGLWAVSSDGRRLATFGGNVRGTLRMREFPSGRILVSVPGVRSGNMTFARGDEWVAAVDSTGRLGAWRTQNGQRMAESQTGLRGVAYLQPGLTPGSVLLVNTEGTSPVAPGRSSLLSWSGTSAAPVVQQTVERDGRSTPVIDARTGRLQLVPFCAPI